jgi:hypothetical protein
LLISIGGPGIGHTPEIDKYIRSVSRSLGVSYLADLDKSSCYGKDERMGLG